MPKFDTKWIDQAYDQANSMVIYDDLAQGASEGDFAVLPDQTVHQMRNGWWIKVQDPTLMATVSVVHFRRRNKRNKPEQPPNYGAF